MTNDQIIEMAHKCEWTGTWSRDRITFARLIAEKQKDIDARIAEDYHDSTNEYVDGYEIAAAIRKGGE